MGRLSFLRAAAFAVGCGVAAGVVLIATVFASGQTFGQRCAADYATDSKAWSSCVTELSEVRR